MDTEPDDVGMGVSAGLEAYWEGLDRARVVGTSDYSRAYAEAQDFLAGMHALLGDVCPAVQAWMAHRAEVCVRLDAEGEVDILAGDPPKGAKEPAIDLSRWEAQLMDFAIGVKALLRQVCPLFGRWLQEQHAVIWVLNGEVAGFEPNKSGA